MSGIRTVRVVEGEYRRVHAHSADEEEDATQHVEATDPLFCMQIQQRVLNVQHQFARADGCEADAAEDERVVHQPEKSMLP